MEMSWKCQLLIRRLFTLLLSVASTFARKQIKTGKELFIMASRIKSNTKFSNVDILDFMKKVVEKHTRYYQSDFEIDKETLRRAAVKQEHQEKTFIWLCRTHGTWCLLERNVFLKETSEYITFNYYAEQSTESVLAFVI